MNRTVVSAAVLAFCGWCYPAHGQTAIATFDDVAGQWAGQASTYKVTLEINSAGKFIAKSALGSETGQAKLQDGLLLVPLPQHDGTLKLTLQGESLNGSGVLSGKTWNVSLLRAQPSVSKK